MEMTRQVAKLNSGKRCAITILKLMCPHFIRACVHEECLTDVSRKILRQREVEWQVRRDEVQVIEHVVRLKHAFTCMFSLFGSILKQT